MSALSLEAELEEVQNALAGTSKSLTAIQSNALRIVAKGVVKAIKGAISSSLQTRTGELLKCYGYKVKKDNSQVNIFPKGKSGSKIFPKVYTLNYGLPGTKHKPYSFIQKGQGFAENGNYMPDIEAFIDKELTKFWG